MARNAVPSGENQSVTGAIDILDLLASNAEPIGVREIARRLALAPSNVQRLIKTLTKAGFLEQTQETLRYRIGYRAFQVGSAFVGQNSLYSAVMPELYALASTSPASWAFFETKRWFISRRCKARARSPSPTGRDRRPICTRPPWARRFLRKCRTTRFASCWALVPCRD